MHSCPLSSISTELLSSGVYTNQHLYLLDVASIFRAGESVDSVYDPQMFAEPAHRAEGVSALGAAEWLVVCRARRVERFRVEHEERQARK